MRTYVSPIGYDTRRVTRPVVQTGLGPDDDVILLRPADDTDTEQAEQAFADVQQLLQEIEPQTECDVNRVPTEALEETIQECCSLLVDVSEERELIVSLGGGARDVLLPLTIASHLFSQAVDRTLFFSDLNGAVEDWPLFDVTVDIPGRAAETLDAIVTADGWQSLSSIASETDQSKSTVIRHVNALEDNNVIESDTGGKAKRVRSSLAGELAYLIR